MSARDNFLAAARASIGTPFRHQGRLPGVGLDCAGVVVCAARSAGFDVADVVAYARLPQAGLMQGAVTQQCDRIELADVRPGDLMLFAFASEPQHLAVVSAISPRIMLIHGYQQVKQVVENDLDQGWLSRLRGCWRIRGMD